MTKINMEKQSKITQSDLHSYFEYSKKTGMLKWKDMAEKYSMTTWICPAHGYKKL